MPKSLQIGHFEVLPDQRQVRSMLQNGAPANLGARAFDLLMCLVNHRDRVVTKDELLAQVWPGLVVEEGNLNVQIHALRKLLGSQSVVTVPGRGFQLGLEVVVPEDSAHTAIAESPDIEWPLPAKPSIAVLTFDNMSDNPEQDFFCEGVTEDIITELAQFNTLFVIARNSSSTYKGKSTKIPQIGKELGVRYVVEGSVRRAGQRIRVTAQLIDAVSGLHVWADHYDRVLEDVFAVQEEVVQAIVAAVAPQVDAAEILRARLRPGDVSAYEIAVQAYAMVTSPSAASEGQWASEGIALARKALAIDPDSHRALIALAVGNYNQLLNRTATDRVAAYNEGMAAAHRGITRSHYGSAHSCKALLLSIAPGGALWDEARAEAENAARLNPQDCWAMGICGYFRAQTGDAAGGIDMLERSLRINPRDPNAYRTYSHLATAYFVVKNYAQALLWSRRSTSSGPHWAFSHLMLASNYVATGDLAAARAALQTAQRLAPGLTTSYLDNGVPSPDASFALRHGTFLRIAAGLLEPGAAKALLQTAS